MAWHNQGRLWLVIHSEANPTRHEWLEFLNDFSGALGDRCMLVYSHGGSPNGAQRNQLEETLRHRPKPPTAVITSSIIGRSVGAIIKFFSPLLRVFAPGDERQAFEYLGLTPAEQQYARSACATLEGELAAARAA